MPRAAALACVTAAAVVTFAPLTGAGDPSRKVDLIWVHPQFDSLGIERVGMLPCATFDNDLEKGKLTEGLLAQSLREKGFRWISSATTHSMLRRAGGGDSLLTVVRDDVLDSPPVDSLLAPVICGVLRCDAVLSVRVDTWEQVKIQPDQSGKPATTVHIKAALVDSLGRVLWTASGSETGEGPYYTPTNDPYRAPGGGSGLRTISSVPPPPGYREVLTRLFARWAERFPARERDG